MRRRPFYWIFPLMILFLLNNFVGTSRAFGQTAIRVSNNTATVTLPTDVTFSVIATSDNQITSITLEYGTNALSCATGVARQKADFSPGKSIDAQWIWDFKTSGSSLPPGAQIWWLWEIKTQDGSVLRTDKQQLTVEDTRLTWQTIANEKVKVVWSQGDQNFGKQMLDLATQSIDRLASNAGISPPGLIRLTIFPSTADLRAAALYLPEWTGGVAFPEYSTTMMGIPPGSDPSWEKDVIPHELAHLVTGQLTANCLGAGMPTWLNEGISVYNEGPDSSMDFNAVTRALKNGTLPPLRNLAAGFSADSNEALLSYAYAGTIVRFMVDTYGAAKLAALLSAIQLGDTINPALESVYNLDTDGLDQTWRASLGYGSGPGGSVTTATPTTLPTTVPTLSLATSAFGKGVKTPKTTSLPTLTPAVSTTSIPPESPATEPATSTPAEIAVANPSPTSGITNTPQPDRQPASPISCFGSNAFLGLGMVGLIVGVARHQKASPRTKLSNRKRMKSKKTKEHLL